MLGCGIESRFFADLDNDWVCHCENMLPLWAVAAPAMTRSRRLVSHAWALLGVLE